MRFTSSLVSLYLAAATVATTIPTTSQYAPPQTSPVDPCTPPSEAVQLLRLYNPTTRDHFYTTFPAEADNAVNAGSYTREGVTGLVFSTQFTGTVPFYRWYSAAELDHFYTVANRSDVPGYVFEGIAAYVYPDTRCGATPLYRLYSYPATDHLYTVSVQDRDQAIRDSFYTSEGIDGYVLPA